MYLLNERKLKWDVISLKFNDLKFKYYNKINIFANSKNRQQINL